MGSLACAADLAAVVFASSFAFLNVLVYDLEQWSHLEPKLVPHRWPTLSLLTACPQLGYRESAWKICSLLKPSGPDPDAIGFIMETLCVTLWVLGPNLMTWPLIDVVSIWFNVTSSAVMI